MTRPGTGVNLEKMKSACLTLAGVAMLCANVTASSQSLALTYDLAVRADTVQPVLITGDRCASSDWLQLLDWCGREPRAAGASSWTVELTDSRAGPETPRHSSPAGSHSLAAVPPYDVPRGPGNPAADVTARTGPATRTPDVSLRFGSQTRARGAEEGREPGRFVDLTYESYLQSNAYKALGVELAVPFH
jgi:hypothetical protein